MAITLLAATSFLLAGCGRDDESVSARARPRKHVVSYGMRIYFGIGGDAARIQLDGWSGPERFFTWSDGTKASLALRLPSDRHDVHLQLRMAGFTGRPGQPFQPVDVLVNSKKLATWEVAEGKTFSLVVPAKLLEPPKALEVKPGFLLTPGWEAVVDFEIPRAVSPKELGISEDPRRLGIQVFELHVTDVARSAEGGTGS